MMKPYFFRIGATQYNLLDAKYTEVYHQASQYIKSLSLENTMLLTLCHDNKSLIAIIVGDRIGYPFSSKLGPFEFMVVEKHISSPEIKIADEMAVQHAIHYLEENLNGKE